MAPSSTSYDTHPCFGLASRKNVGRLHLPVAPRANSKIRFSGLIKAKPAMLPEEAMTWLKSVISEGTTVDVVGITGPGDPMAVPEPTLRTLNMVHAEFPKISLCMTTVGIGSAKYASELAALGLSHVTLLVDAVSPEVAENLYAWVRPSTKTVPLPEAVQLLMKDQADAVVAFKEAGITVKINTTVYPGINAGHVEEIASTMASLGADIMAVVPYRPDPDCTDAPAECGAELMDTIREGVARHLHLMPAWEDCGEDIVGLTSLEKRDAPISVLPKPTADRPNVAVVSSGGMDVDLHLGHAVKVLIYGPREDGLPCLLESRDAPEPGSGSRRWKDLSKLLKDCFVLLTASAGEKPRQILSRDGLSVLITDGEIAGTVDVLYGGGKKGKKFRKQ